MARGVPLVTDSGINWEEVHRGYQGVKGDKGDPGEKGDRGEKGDKGDKGDQGQKGDKGDCGDKGEKGDRGETGERGLKGDVGERGDRGFTGAQGERGLPGEKGEKGDNGYPVLTMASLYPITGGKIVEFDQLSCVLSLVLVEDGGMDIRGLLKFEIDGIEYDFDIQKKAQTRFIQLEHPIFTKNIQIYCEKKMGTKIDIYFLGFIPNGQ